jgi:hypothetical protein
MTAIRPNFINFIKPNKIMKKKLFIGLAGVVAIAAAVCVTLTSVYQSSTSDLMSKNIEALTLNEDVDARKQSLQDSGYDCTISIDVAPGQYIYQDGDYGHCVNDPAGYTNCRNACVAKK